MNAKQIKRNNSLARWAVLLKECKESGLQVREWLAQTLRKNYINPAIELGVLRMTIPDNLFIEKKTLDILLELHTIK